MWMTHRWSLSSTNRPRMSPRIQSFGSVGGHVGSISHSGGAAVVASAVVSARPASSGGAPQPAVMRSTAARLSARTGRIMTTPCRRSPAIQRSPGERRHFRPTSGLGDVPASDAATAVGPAFAPTLAGTHFGLGFDPVADVIRTSSSETEQNLRVDPIDGSLTAVDGSFAFAAGDAHEGTNPSVGVNTV